MIPVTRKELYLNKIVGNNEYEIPEKPISEEELFFAEILGEAVQAPEPLTRYQIYLAKIAGRNISVPKPLTRLELFLAKACGMDIEIPTPITREEIFWSNYSAIVDFEVEGVPPLTYKAIEGTLENYRIYGNTVDGESVGDRTGNLFDKNAITIGYAIPINGVPEQNENFCMSDFIDVSDKTFCKAYNLIKGDILWTLRIHGYNSSKDWVSQLYEYTVAVNTPISSDNINIPSNVKYIKMSIGYVDRQNLDILMFSTNTNLNDYEPYGYKVLATVEGKNLININADGVEQGKAIILSSSTVKIVENASWSISDYISIDNTTYYYKTLRTYNTNTVSFILYDSEKNRVGTCFAFRGNNFIFSINNAEAKFIRCTWFNTDDEIMLCKNSDGQAYEPYHAPVTTPIYLPEQIKKVGDEAEYVDYKEQKQHRVRKNLLQNTATTKTINGVTFTVNDDGSIDCTRANTQATGVSVLTITSEELSFTEDYILTGCPARGSNGSYFMRYIYDGDTGTPQQAFDYGSGVAIPKNKSGNIQIRFASGYNFDGTLTFRPMIRKADIEDDTYEPYIEDTELDITLPALPTLSGTNTLSVGTEIQPSKVYVKGEKEREYT